MQFSLARLLIAQTVFAAVLGLTKLIGFDLRGSVMAATGIGGLVLLAGEKGLHMSPRVNGFSPGRIAWALAILCWVAVPAHLFPPFMDCEMSERLDLAAVAVWLLIGGLELAEKRNRQATPFVLAFVSLFAHGLFTPA